MSREFKTSIIDAIDIAELRMWALSGLWQNPHLLKDADGTVFLSSGVSYPIFTAMRSLSEAGHAVTLPSILDESDLDINVALGLAQLPGVKIDERMAYVYLNCLANRFEPEEVRHAA